MSLTGGGQCMQAGNCKGFVFFMLLRIANGTGNSVSHPGRLQAKTKAGGSRRVGLQFLFPSGQENRND